MSFVFSTPPMRVVFGVGTRERVGEEVRRLGRGRVLLLGGARRGDAAGQVAAELDELVVGRFDGAVMHTPVSVTDRALEVLRECGADCVVAVGGGSTIGLGKALAARTDLDQVVLPTTYSGSEVTAVVGETTDEGKTTRSGPEILPETVIYDVEFTRSLPVATSVTSGVNAMAHAVEALYAEGANPVVDALAVDALRRMGRALRLLPERPLDVDVRTDALHAAWLAGTCLGWVGGLGLHHKLCHTLGGSFDLPHSETHTVVLPYAMAYNAVAVPEVIDRVGAALGLDGQDAAEGLRERVRVAGGPVSLRELGMPEDQLEHAATLATAKPYPNPRAVTTEGIAELLRAAWRGDSPTTLSR